MQKFSIIFRLIPSVCAENNREKHVMVAWLVKALIYILMFKLISFHKHESSPSRPMKFMKLKFSFCLSLQM